MQQLNRKAPSGRMLLAVPAWILTGAFGLLSVSITLAAGAPPVSPRAAASPYPPDPNDPTPPQEKAQEKAQESAQASSDPAQVAQGKQLYKAYCQKCHGIDMMSPGPPFYDLRGFPHDEKPRFISSVTHGKRAMPAWGAIVKLAEIESLWAYVAAYKPQ